MALAATVNARFGLPPNPAVPRPPVPVMPEATVRAPWPCSVIQVDRRHVKLVRKLSRPFEGSFLPDLLGEAFEGPAYLDTITRRAILDEIVGWNQRNQDALNLHKRGILACSEQLATLSGYSTREKTVISQRLSAELRWISRMSPEVLSCAESAMLARLRNGRRRATTPYQILLKHWNSRGAKE